MEVLFEGQLERSNLFSGKEWKRGYAVLRKHPTTGSKVLEFYKDSHWNKNEPKAVCNLLSSYEASYVVGSTKKRFVFELKTVDHTYELGAPSEALRKQWIDKLNSAKDILNDSSIQNIIQTFNVALVDETLVRKHLNGFSGTCQLMVTDSEVIVVAAGQIKIRWKFSTIRRYKSQTETFVIEVGRKAPTGEGEFRFDTVNPIELFDVLDKAVKDRIRAKGIEISTLTPSSDTAPSFPSPPSGVGRMQPPARVASTNTEYSHLDQHMHKPNLATSSTEYDLLFNKDRFQQKRRSEPVIKAPPFDHNARKLTADSQFSNEHAAQANEDEEMYEDMNASLKHHDVIKSSGDQRRPPSSRPLPPPRGVIPADG
ncbi:docking protein 2-like [Clytia hemisphaerica]|uniref:PH domain-containing protein n=1 Tax=Clytia hemisphaerica TaxID=252671 RepID=A0A7M5XDI9_9CNID